MPDVTFVDAAGIARTVTAEAGRSLMEAARLHDVPGITAMCCGFGVCATCHVYIDEAFLDRLNPVRDKEAALLARVGQRRPTSRLSCQVRVDPALEGLRVETPVSQG